MKRILFLLSVFLALPAPVRADVAVDVGPVSVRVYLPRPVVVVPVVKPVAIQPGSTVIRPLLPWRPVIVVPPAPEPKK